MWFRRDLRLGDNPALLAAARAGAVLPLFVGDEALWAPSGANRRAWLAGCLAELDEATGGHLLLRRGAPAQVVAAVAREISAGAVYAAADFGPYGRSRDEAVGAALAEASVDFVRVGSPYAVAPGAVTKPDGDPYRVFTPYFRAWRAQETQIEAGGLGHAERFCYGELRCLSVGEENRHAIHQQRPG